MRVFLSLLFSLALVLTGLPGQVSANSMLMMQRQQNMMMQQQQQQRMMQQQQQQRMMQQQQQQRMQQQQAMQRQQQQAMQQRQQQMRLQQQRMAEQRRMQQQQRQQQMQRQQQQRQQQAQRQQVQRQQQVQRDQLQRQQVQRQQVQRVQSQRLQAQRVAREQAVMRDRQQRLERLRKEDRLRRLSTDLKGLVIDLRKADRQVRSRVVIASQHAITTSLLPPLIATRLDALGYRLRLRSANRSECWGMLITKEADLVLTYQSISELSNPPEEYVEQLVISKEDLIPVGTAALRDQIDAGRLPVIAYPSDVFMGKLIDSEVHPYLSDTMSREIKVETALTVAAMQLAANGVGIAWIPRSMLENLPAKNGLLSFSDILPTPRIATVATRLIGKKSNAEQAIWKELETVHGK